jgi:hypothetical protein
MKGRIMCRLPVVAALMFMAVMASGCGADDSSSESGTKSSATPAQQAATADPATGLVGKWSTQNVCADEVRAFKKAGVAKIGREFLGGEYEGQIEGASDLCKGAKPKQHSHGFQADGAFASYDQDGQQVDEGTYKKVNSHTFTLGEPPVPVRYVIKGDTATFDVEVPHCKDARCRKSTAYVVSAFFPRIYKRIN